MVDWKDLAKKGLNKSVEITKKGVEAGIDWKNDPERLKKVEQQKAFKAEEKLANKPNVFKPNKTVGKLFLLDTITQQFKVGGYANAAYVYDLNQISSYELVENGHSVSSGGLGRSALGAVTFGGVGAVVGAVTGGKKTKNIVESLKIKINMDNIDKPVVYIDILTSKTKNNSLIYKDAIQKADEIISLLESISKSKENNGSQPVEVDELMKYKMYLDEGIISQEEFNKKKQELLKL